jgi:hypothetical protein
MAISICRENETLFAIHDDGNALIPMDENERAAVFETLTDALAILANIRPRPNVATEVGTSCLQQTEPNRGDRKPCVIVRLSERRNNESEVTLTE